MLALPERKAKSHKRRKREKLKVSEKLNHTIAESMKN
jgi:hypothetical protein